MRDTPARRELEATLRGFLPARGDVGTSLATSKPGSAVLGVGGVFTGYLWGRWRGRRRRKQR